MVSPLGKGGGVKKERGAASFPVRGGNREELSFFYPCMEDLRWVREKGCGGFFPQGERGKVSGIRLQIMVK